MSFYFCIDLRIHWVQVQCTFYGTAKIIRTCRTIFSDCRELGKRRGGCGDPSVNIPGIPEPGEWVWRKGCSPGKSKTLFDHVHVYKQALFPSSVFKEVCLCTKDVPAVQTWCGMTVWPHLGRKPCVMGGVTPPRLPRGNHVSSPSPSSLASQRDPSIPK